MSLLTKLKGSMHGVSLSELDAENIGSWPPIVRGFVCFFMMLLVFGLGYKYHIEDIRERLAQAKSQEVTLKEQFSLRAFQAAHLEEYKEQLVLMEHSFGALLKQLPGDTEVPGLLEDITNAGLNSGLAFEEIKLQPESVQQFYVELPIRVRVEGDYHDLATFVTKVASMPRIVTLHDFNLKPVGGSAKRLSMDIMMKTYRYKGQGDEA